MSNKQAWTLAVLIVALFLGWLSTRSTDSNALNEVSGEGVIPTGVLPVPTPRRSSPTHGLATSPFVGEESLSCIVRVMSSHGEPLPEATVVQFDAHRIAEAAMSGQDGRATLSVAPDASLMIQKCGFRPVLYSPMKAGEVTIELPAEPSLLGKLIVDDSVPRSAYELKLLCSRPWFDTAAIPSHLVPHLSPLGIDGMNGLRILTNQDGTFRARGLSGVASCSVVLPDSLMLEDTMGERTIKVAAVSEPIEIRATSVPSIRGRLVSRGKAVVSGTRVLLSAQNATLETRSDPSGHFLFSLVMFKRAQSVSIRAAADGLGEATLELKGPFLQTIDVGEIELATGRTARFRITDTNGQPIPNAIVRTLDVDPTLYGSRADKEGVCVIQGMSSVAATACRISALEYISADAQTPAVDEELSVVLARSNVLTIRIVDAQSRPVGNMRVEVSRKQGGNLFAHREWNPDLGHVHLGATLAEAARWTDKEGRALFLADEHGIVTLAGMAPGEVTVTPLDSLCGRLESKSVHIHTVGRHAVAFELADMLVDAHGTVVDEEAMPVVGATVRLTNEEVNMKESLGRNIVTLTTSWDGTFRIPRIAMRQLSMHIHLDGHEPIVKNVTVPQDGDFGRLQLLRGCQVTVVLPESARDSTGVYAKSLSGQVVALGKRMSETTFRLSGLPRSDVVVVARVPGDEFTIVHDARAGDCKFPDLPKKCTAEVRCDLDIDYSASMRAVVRMESGRVLSKPLRLERQKVQSIGHLRAGKYQVSLEVRGEDGKWTRVSQERPLILKAHGQRLVVFE